MKLLLPSFCFSLLVLSACGQMPRPDLYRCEGCEAIHEHPFEDLSWQTVIPPEGEPGDPLLLSGIVYERDGTTPAPGVVIYAHHTNAAGVYPPAEGATGWARRHGYLRGWVKTDAQGRYQFRTIRPASYPNSEAPAHIHLIIKEPDHREYWIDDVVFEGDPYVTASRRQRQHPRGGSGVITLTRDAEGRWHGTRDIVLEPHPTDQ